MIKRNKNFTLVELLIVIAIIAILAGMLLPALSSARAKALSVQCTSNQKQLANAVLMYTVDHNDYFPHKYLKTYNMARGMMDVFCSYITKPRITARLPYFYSDVDYKPVSPVFLCPAGDDKTFSDYIICYWISGSAWANPRYVKITQVKRPTRLFLTADGRGDSDYDHYNATIANPRSYRFRHSGGFGFNESFVDGHVEESRRRRICASQDEEFWY